MHIKLLYRKVLYVFLSAILVIAPAAAYANTSLGGWTVTDSVIAGVNTTINATKTSASGALKSAITVAPNALKVGGFLLRGGAVGALAMAIPQLIGEGVDYVLDPANNTVTYSSATYDTEGDTALRWSARNGYYFSTPEAACANLGQAFGFALFYKAPTSCVSSWQEQKHGDVYSSTNPNYNSSSPQQIAIPLADVTTQVIANAEAGHVESQEALKSAAIESFVAGDYDTDLEAAAVPDTSAGTGTGTGTDTSAGTGTGTGTDTSTTTDPATFDPSSIISAVKSVMDAVVNMSVVLIAKIDALMIDLGLKHDEKIVADAANTAAIVSAVQAIEGNTLDGKVINDAVDRAIAAGATDTSSIVAAIEAIEGNTLTGEVINDAIDRVIANDNVNAQSAADAASDAAAADAANTAAVTDAIGAQTDAISQADPVTGATSLKLPSFCGWAGTVCDYMDWVKGEYQTVSDFVKAEPEVTPDDPIVVADDPSGLGNIFQDKAEAGYVSFESSCPADVLIPIDLMGASQVLNISYTPFCHFASMIRYAVILGAWISGLLIVTGGRSRE